MESYRSGDFSAFTAPGADRFAVLDAILRARNLEAAAVKLGPSRIFILGPERRTSTPAIVLVAHWDRAVNSPGANDNSAAIFALIETARRLREAKVPGWLVVFTDSEEAASESGARAQGSYALAQGLKSLEIESASIFIFDCCGVGDCLIVSTALDSLLSDGKKGLYDAERSTLRQLRLKAFEAARSRNSLPLHLAPTPFSDDAGFLAAGLLAQTVTLLPQREISPYLQATRGPSGLARTLLSREARDAREGGVEDIPLTWRRLHSGEDSVDTLWPDSLALVSRFAVALCSL